MFLTIQSAKANGPLIVTGNPEAPPIVWERNGQLIGVGPEAATRILTNLQIPFIIKSTGTWKDVQQKAKNGAIDLIVSAYENKDRRQYMKYSVPYLKSPVIIVVKKGNAFPFSSWQDLVGKKGVANVGESFGEKFDSFIQEKLDVHYMPYRRAFEMMKLGTADYLIIDLYPAVIYAKLLNVEDEVEFLDNPATVQHFHMTLSKKSPFLNLLPKINEQITTMKKKGLFTQMAKEQYSRWNATFLKRQRFYAKSQARSQKQKSEWNAGAHDRGLDNLVRFMERDHPFMTGIDSVH
jgi:polar amino acid transport system substrate-binding protein